MTDNTKDQGKYLICEYCNAIFPKQCSDGRPRHDDHPDGCPVVTLCDDEAGPCYTCNSDSNRISCSQRTSRGWKARCEVCVSDKVWNRYKLFDVDDIAGKMSVARLHDAVGRIDVEQVDKLILEGVDPNGVCQLRERRSESASFSCVPIWNHDRSIFPNLDEHSPNTALKLVVFRISDCMLGDKNLDQLAHIAKLLITAGADQSEAIAYAKSRYGEKCFTNASRLKSKRCLAFDRALQQVGKDQPALTARARRY